MSGRAPLSVISSAESQGDDVMALEEDAETQQDFSEFAKFLDGLDAERECGSKGGDKSDVVVISDDPSSKPPVLAKDDHPSALSTKASGSDPPASDVKSCPRCYGKQSCTQPALEETMFQV